MADHHQRDRGEPGRLPSGLRPPFPSTSRRLRGRRRHGYLFQRAAVERNGKTRIAERVIEYFSRPLPKSIRCYDARRLDLLAILEALEHFRHIFEGCRISLEPDHQSLQYLRSNRMASGQLGRWCMRLGQFNYEFSYRPGHLQHVSGSLSRLPLPTGIELDDEGEPLSLRPTL